MKLCFCASAASAREILAARHRPLRIGGRGEIERDGAGEQIVRERIEIGEEAVLGGRIEIDRLALGRDRAGGVGRIERVRHQDRRLAGALAGKALRRDRGEEQALARAAEHEDFAQRLDRTRERVAAVEPARDGLTETIRAGIARIAAEIRGVLGEDRRDERRHGMLRLADRNIDRRHAGRGVAQQVGQPHERRACVGCPSGRGRAFGCVHGPSFRRRDAPPDWRCATIGGGRLRAD